MAEPVTHQPTPAADGPYHAVLHFYARQMQLLDDGAIDEWAGTYTEDATFGSNAMPAPLAGRDAIRRGAREHDNLRQAGTRRRHLMSNLSIAPGEDGAIKATSYVTIVETREGTTALRFSTLLEDELVRKDGELLVRTRRIKRDDLG